MKKKLICTALLFALITALSTGCAQEVPAPAESSAESTQSSVTPSRTESSQPEERSQPESSREISLPQPGENLPDIPMKSADFEALVTTMGQQELTIIDSVPTAEPLAENENITVASLTLTVNAEWKNLTAFLKKVVQQEKNDLYLDKLSIEKGYYDTFNCTVTIVNPYPAGEGAVSEEDAQQLIKSRFRAVNRQKLLDAFMSVHANYSLQKALCQFTVDSERRTAIDAEVNFASYKGFVSYRYRINESKDFTVNDDVKYEQQSDDSEMPFHVSLTLYTDKFTV